MRRWREVGRVHSAVAAAFVLLACEAEPNDSIEGRSAEYDRADDGSALDGGPSIDASSKPGAPISKLGSRPGHAPAPDELFGENVGVVLLDPWEHEPDKADPGALHVHTHPDHEAFVLAGGAALANAVELLVEDMPVGARIMIAQGLLSELAEADLAVVASVTEVSDPITDEEGAPTYSVMVTFNVESTALGTAPSSFALPMFDGSLKAADMQEAPEVGTRHLVLLRKEGTGWSLGGQMRPVVDDYVGGFPGARLPVASVVAIAKQNEEVLPWNP